MAYFKHQKLEVSFIYLHEEDQGCVVSRGVRTLSGGQVSPDCVPCSLPGKVAPCECQATVLKYILVN